MLKANELRIGNWISGRNDPTMKVVSINYAGCVELRFDGVDGDYGDWYYESEDLQPIPLTPEILENAGFIKADTKQNDNIEFTFYSSKAVDKDIFSIRTDRMKELQRVLVVPVFKTIALPMHLNTVHQLQNLYFALTGNELEINL